MTASQGKDMTFNWKLKQNNKLTVTMLSPDSFDNKNQKNTPNTLNSSKEVWQFHVESFREPQAQVQKSPVPPFLRMPSAPGHLQIHSIKNGSHYPAQGDQSNIVYSSYQQPAQSQPQTHNFSNSSYFVTDQHQAQLQQPKKRGIPRLYSQESAPDILQSNYQMQFTNQMNDQRQTATPPPQFIHTDTSQFTRFTNNFPNQNTARPISPSTQHRSSTPSPHPSIQQHPSLQSQPQQLPSAQHSHTPTFLGDTKKLSSESDLRKDIKTTNKPFTPPPLHSARSESELFANFHSPYKHSNVNNIIIETPLTSKLAFLDLYQNTQSQPTTPPAPLNSNYEENDTSDDDEMMSDGDENTHQRMSIQNLLI